MNKRDLLCEIGLENAIVFENPDYQNAIVGYDVVSERVVYSYDKMIECLMSDDNMSYDEAIEFIEYNTIRACPYMGDKSPIILQNIEDF